MVAPGDQIARRYLLEATIASGGMGTVFRAVDRRLDRTVALKVLKPELAHEANSIERFRREARAVAALSHPNIANVYDYGEDEGSHFLVMELAPGQDLAQRMTTEAPFSPDRVVRIASQIASALGHAHAAGVIHRDVKPANVIVGDDDTVKVTDFGIARVAGDSTLTATGALLGTATYLSPEQAQGSPLDPRSDIYSLGIVMFEMLTGEVPFAGDSAVNVAMRHLTDDVPSPSEFSDGIPAWLDAAVVRSTRRDPSERFTDGSDLADALSKTSAGDTIALPVLEPTAEVAPTETLLPLPDRWDPARLGRAIFLVGGILVVIALGLVLWRLAQDGDETRERRQTQATSAPEEESEGETSPSAPAEEATYELPTDLIGADAAQARQVLEEVGFVVEEVTVASEEPAGTVVDSDPEPGSTVQSGDTITLYVSDGADEGGPPGGTPPGKAKKEDDD
ncbi:MAG: protein kinase domain-containing protein [Actinomycetota bacterium]